MNAKIFSAQVPLPLAEKVDRIAARMERSRGWIMKQALDAWIEQEEERRRLTLAAWLRSMPGPSSTTKRCKLGLTALIRTRRCQYLADGIEMDRQGTVGSGASADHFCAAALAYARRSISILLPIVHSFPPYALL